MALRRNLTGPWFCWVSVIGDGRPGSGLDGLGSESPPMFTGLSARSWSPSPGRGESAPFSSLPDASRRASRRIQGLPEHAAPGSLGRSGCSNRTILGKAKPPKHLVKSAVAPTAASRTTPAGSQGPRPSQTGQFSSSLVLRVGQGGELWSRKFQEGQNAQVSANCPLLRILAQSPFSEALCQAVQLIQL